jgi:hypothetical protein
MVHASWSENPGRFVVVGQALNPRHCIVIALSLLTMNDIFLSANWEVCGYMKSDSAACWYDLVALTK